MLLMSLGLSSSEACFLRPFRTIRKLKTNDQPTHFALIIATLESLTGGNDTKMPDRNDDSLILFLII